MHDFRLKLSDPRTAPALNRYLAKTRAARRTPGAGGTGGGENANDGPISINLDLTLACDYRCGHCIDAELLNGGKHLGLDTVRATLRLLAERGLRSVILIGGGEPALHPQFEEAVAEIKGLGLQCAIVSNGAHNDRIARVAGPLGPGDWVRLSLDAGTDETFQMLHRPRKKVTLEEICRTAARIKEAAPQVQLGYSFVILWRSEGQMFTPAASNVNEMVLAARLAKASGFDYISFKPMLARGAGRAEVVNLGSRAGGGGREPGGDAEAVEQIRAALGEAQRLADAGFGVAPSRNLLALLDGSARQGAALQPRTCHMQKFRHVVTPLGVFACPAHRGNESSWVAEADAYATPDGCRRASEAAEAQIRRFDAATECREITCIYNETNWWIETLVESGEEVTPAPAADLFL